MEQRIQKIINPKQSSIEDFLLIPIEPLRTVPTALPTKRITHTGNDS